MNKLVNKVPADEVRPYSGESTDWDNLAFSPVLLLSVSLPIYFKFPHSSYIGMPMPAVFGRVISNTCLLQAM